MGAAATLLTTGCLGGGTDGVGSGDGQGQLPLAETHAPLTRSLDEYNDSIVSGGVPKDGIPSIDDPSHGDGSYLQDGDVVFGVEIDGEARAYPQRVLVWHEIVNDSVAGTNVSVTYCPLTGTVIGFMRGTTSFGVSGRLVNSNLVMYDRKTNSWWPQVLRRAVRGDLEGETLREFHVVWTTWGRWRDLHPDTTALTRETGHARNYSRDPYGSYNPAGGYYADGDPNFPVMNTAPRHKSKEVVVGARTRDGAVAFHKDTVRQEGSVTKEVGGTPHTARYDEALETARVTRDGEPVNSFDAMWFAWASFYPDTK